MPQAVRQVYLDSLRSLIQTTSPESDRLFSLIMLLIIESGIMTEKELADELLVSIPTIGRWVRGRNLPHYNLRLKIHKFLSDKIEHLCRQL